MPNWKGKKVSNAHYFNLRRSVEFRLHQDRDSWGLTYKAKPYKIGGKKNANHIRRGFIRYA